MKERDEVERIVLSVLGSRWRVEDLTEEGFWIRFMNHCGLGDGFTIKLANFLELSDRLGTDRINLVHSAGWAGTDVTPGDPERTDVRVLWPRKETENVRNTKRR